MRFPLTVTCLFMAPLPCMAEPALPVGAMLPAHTSECERSEASLFTTEQKTAPLITVGRFPIFSALSRSPDVFQSPDSVYIGGLPTHGWGKTGQANNTVSRPGSLVITGQPWGPYNAGALENILWGIGVDQQNGVANVDWRAGQVPPFDGVGQYTGVTNASAMVIAPAKFMAGQAIISPALTPAQLSMLRIGMYVSTNIINSQISEKPINNWVGDSYPLVNFYQGILAGWQQSFDSAGKAITLLTVPAWGNYNFKQQHIGSVPGYEKGDSIDTLRSNYKKPMVFIGNDTGETAHNDYFFYDGRKSSSQENKGYAKALSHTLSDTEVDLRYYATKPKDVTVNGITVSIASMMNSPVGREAMTSGSYLMNLSGDIPNILILDGAADANIIQGHSFYLHGQEGTYFPKGYTATQTKNRKIQTNFAFTSFADSINSLNLISYQQAYGHSQGATNTSYHLGLHADGNFKFPTTTGSNYGEIEWNPKGAWGASIALCAAQENCGLIHDGNGMVHLNNGAHVKEGGVTAGSGLVIGPQPQGHNAGLGLYMPVSNITTLLEIIQGNEELLSLQNTGNFILKKTFLAKQNVIAQGNIVAIGYFQQPLKTPPSSQAPCSAGQFMDDENFHYVCVGKNHWKRSALSDF